ncbi:MAG: ferrochelatase [Acidobacteria bacterium]|nr:ferrochelatase [Acidobacteriota bacterium]
MQYDAILFTSFGGPEKPEDVIPFLENVLRGKHVPRERMLEVAEHYYAFNGHSPINAQNRALIAAIEAELAAKGPHLPVYWGNRNWHPLLPDTLRRMRDDGVRRALAFMTSAYSSYSGCRQYREDIARAQAEIGFDELEVHKIRAFFNHPGFIGPMARNVRTAIEAFPAERRGGVELLFTAHSVPLAMSTTSRYVEQLEEACRLVREAVGKPSARLVWQSRSGPPTQPWLEPDIGDALRELAAAGRTRDVVIAPIGFISDHMEVLYDLDTEAREICETLGLEMQRAATVGVDPEFVSMIRELIVERIDESAERRALGALPASHDVCPPGCCPKPERPGPAR